MKVLSLDSFAVCVPFLLLGTFAIASPPEGRYHLIMKDTLGGEGGGDYMTLDASMRRLYLSHSTHVNVIDVDSGAVVGSDW